MHIVYFYQYFGTSKGGWSTRVYEMTRRWVDSGAKVTVVTSMYDKSDLVPEKFVTNLVIDGVNVKLINIRLSNKHGFVTRLSSFLRFSITAAWYALSLKYDVVIASSGPLTIGIPGVLAKIFRRKTFIFEIRDLWPRGAIELGALKNKTAIAMAKWFEKLCYGLADLVVAASPGQMEHVLQVSPGKTVAIVPNAADNHLMQIDLSMPMPDWAYGKKLVLYAGTLGLIDDCATIVNVAHEFKNRQRNDIEVVLVGDGKERISLMEMANAMDLDNIHFMGLTSKENVMRWLSKSKISLFTVKNVPFLDTASPNKVFDAFAAGIPIVQNTQGWVKEYMDKNFCGITVPKSDPVAMADAVLRLLDDEALWDTIAKNSKRAAETDFDRDMLSQKMLDAIYTAKNKK